MVCHKTPYFISIYISFVNSKLSLNPVADPPYCSQQHFQDIGQITFLLTHFKIPLISYFRLVAKQVKSGETTKKFLQMSHFLLHSFIEHSLCLVVLGNNNGDKISLRFLFFLLRFLCDT